MKITAEDIAELLARAPPREVPAPVVAVALGGGVPRFLPLFGLFFFGLGLLFTWLFFPWQFVDEWRLTVAESPTTEGVISEVSRTNMSVNKTKVLAYGFRYTPVGGPPRVGRCYTTGPRWGVGAAVTVRYLPADPAVACVEGARLSQSGLTGAIVIIFPLVGCTLVVWFVADRRQKRRLLREGLVAEVDILSVEETAIRVNNQNICKITFRAATLNNGQPITISRSNRPDVDLARKHGQEKQPVFVLYDPRNHTRVLFPEALISL